MELDSRDPCPITCPACPTPRSSAPSRGDRPRDADAFAPHAVSGEGGDQSASRPLAGGRLMLSAAYVFGVPLAAVVTAVVGLAGRLGELPALGVGLAGGVVLMVPAWWFLGRRSGCVARGAEEVSS